MVNVLKTLELNCEQFVVIDNNLFIYERVYFDRTVKYLKREYFGRDYINLIRVYDFEKDDIKLTFTGSQILAIFEDYYVVFETEFLDSESRVSLYKSDEYLSTYNSFFSSMGNLEDRHILDFITYEDGQRYFCSYDFINQKIKWKNKANNFTRLCYSNGLIFAAERDNVSAFHTPETSLHHSQLSFREEGLNTPLLCFSAIDGKKLWSLVKPNFSFYDSLHKVKMKFDDKNNILVIKSTDENFIGIDIKSGKIAWDIGIGFIEYLHIEFILDKEQHSIYTLRSKGYNLMFTIINVINGSIIYNEEYTLIPKKSRWVSPKILGIYSDSLFVAVIDEIYKINRSSKKIELFYQIQGAEISNFVLFKNKILIYTANINDSTRHQNGKIDIIQL